MSNSRTKPQFFTQLQKRNRNKRLWFESLVPLTASNLLSLLSNPGYRGFLSNIKCLGFGTKTFKPKNVDPSYSPFIKHLRSLEGQIIYVATKSRQEFDSEAIKHHFRLIGFPEEIAIPPSNVDPKKLCSGLGFEFIPGEELAKAQAKPKAKADLRIPYDPDVLQLIQAHIQYPTQYPTLHSFSDMEEEEEKKSLNDEKFDDVEQEIKTKKTVLTKNQKK